MANSLIGNSAVATHLYQAFYGQAPSNALYNAYLSEITLNGQAAFAATLAGNFSHTTDAALALQVLGNLGINATTVPATGEYAKLLADLTTLFAAYPTMRGQVILNATGLFANLESDPTYGAAATTYNTQALANFTYASNTANTSPGVASINQTITLTTGADTGAAFTGGAGNDTFVGIVGATSTLTAGDILAGGAGTDTLTIAATGAPVATSAIVLSGIENISISNYETTAASIDLSQATGLAKISVAASTATGDTTVLGVGNLVAAEMSNGTGDLIINYTDTAVTGSADIQTLTLSAQTAGIFGVKGATKGVETLNIVSNGAANTIAVQDLAAAKIKTINVSGAQDLTLTEDATDADDAVTAINAGTFTGALAVTTGSAAADMSITGGTGNDTITFSGSTFTAADSVDGGSGADTLVLASAITTAATLANVTNVETLKITGANNVTLAGNISATTLDVTDGTVVSVITLNTGYTNATTVKADLGDTVANSANVALTVNFKAAEGALVTGGTGTDTLNITADNGTVTFASRITKVDSITIVDGGDVQTGTVTAGKDVTLNLGAYATALTIDGSALDAGTGTAGALVNDETLTVDGSSATANLIITGGGGADSITGGTANDSINAGAGDDVVTMGTNLTTDDTLDGGAGNDTLAVSSLAATSLTHVTNFETLALSGASAAATLASNLSFTTISMTVDTNVAQVLTLNTGYTNATTVSVDAGDKVVNSANVALTVDATAAGMAGTTITGGTGTDTLNITADNGTVTFASLITNVDTVNIVDGALPGKDLTLTLGAYAKALTINASVMGAADATAADTTAEILTVSGASVTKALTITVGAGGSVISTGTGAFNDVVTGGAGVDAITSGAGNDNYSLGDGADTVNMAGFLDNNDTIAGGAGTDTLSVNSGTVDVSYMNVTSMNKLTLLDSGTTTLSTYANAAGITTITGFASGVNTVTATGMTANLTINAATTGGIIDSLTGGSGNDNFVFAGVSSTALPSLTTDAVIGGSGTDTLTLSMSSAGTGNIAATLTNVATIEGITVTSAAASTSTVSLTAVDGNFVSVTGAAVNASGMAGSGTFYFDGSAEADSTFALTGATASSTLIGGSGADTITGGAAADKIVGGLGADVMTGGLGADTFYYAGSGFETGTISPATVYYGGTVAAGSSVSTTGMDKILDFAVGDIIQTNTTTSADMTTNATGALWSAVTGFLKGTYDSTAGTFVFSTTGTDSLYVYDFDGSTSTNDMRGIVLVGYVDTGTTDGPVGGTGLVGIA